VGGRIRSTIGRKKKKGRKQERVTEPTRLGGAGPKKAKPTPSPPNGSEKSRGRRGRGCVRKTENVDYCQTWPKKRQVTIALAMTEEEAEILGQRTKARNHGAKRWLKLGLLG